MKKFLIWCSALISMSFVFPFINGKPILEVFKALGSTYEISDILTTKLVLLFILFIIGSWFLTISYSKKRKISIIGILGMFIYLFFYFKIFTFLGKGDSFFDKVGIYFNYDLSISSLKSPDDVDTLSLLFLLIKSLSDKLSFGYYVILFSFIGNSLAILSVVRNIILDFDRDGEKIYKNESSTQIKDNNIIETTKENKEKYNEIIEEEDLNFIWSTQKNKLKIIGFFILGNIFGTIILSFIWGELIAIVTKETPNIQSGLIIGVLVIIASINVFLVNNYVYSFINRKKLIKIIGGVFVLLYIWVIYYNYTIGILSF